LRIEGDIQFSF